MKRYINASDGSKQKTLQSIRRSINEDINEYYEAWGYDHDYPIPKCRIKKQPPNENGEIVYKITVDMDVFETLPSFINVMCHNFDLSIYYYVSPDFKVSEEFSWDGNTEFTGYITEI